MTFVKGQLVRLIEDFMGPHDRFMKAGMIARVISVSGLGTVDLLFPGKIGAWYMASRELEPVDNIDLQMSLYIKI